MSRKILWMESIFSRPQQLIATPFVHYPPLSPSCFECLQIRYVQNQKTTNNLRIFVFNVFLKNCCSLFIFSKTEKFTVVSTMCFCVVEENLSIDKKCSRARLPNCLTYARTQISFKDDKGTFTLMPIHFTKRQIKSLLPSHIHFNAFLH